MMGSRLITKNVRGVANIAALNTASTRKFSIKTTHKTTHKTTQKSFASQASMATQKYKLPENFNTQYYNRVLDDNNPLSLDKLQCNFINGEWVKTAETFPVYDPATEQPIAYMPNMTVEDVKYAIDSAQAAFPAYAAMSMKQRHDILIKWFQLIKEYSNEMSRIITLENGKCEYESNTEMNFTAGLIEWYAEQCRGIDGSIIPGVQGKRFMAFKQPVGVCSIILPWNVPAAMYARKMGAALAVGCTVVIKAASETPMTAIALTKLAEMAGMPKGVINVITTAHKNVASVGEEMCTNPTVKKISFTGSGSVGKTLKRQAAGTVKRLSLELGGNAPFIAFEDCDIDAAVDGLIASKFRNSGQTCVCANRAFVHKNIFDKFMEKLTEKVSQFKTGPGYVTENTIGPLVNAKAVQKCKELVDQAKSVGAKVVFEGGDSFSVPFEKGFFYPPTLLNCKDVDTSKIRMFKEEIFGPVLPVYQFETDEEVVEKANSVIEGLASYIYTNSLNKSVKISEALHYGMVGLNAGLLSHPETPFGGVKESGYGREGARVGMEEFMETKLICMGGHS